MSRYVLMPAAQEDLAAIRDYYQQEAGPLVARWMLLGFVESFRFLARTPGAGHVRQDLAESRPIRFWPVRDDLILYRLGTQPLEILSIFRGSRDLPALLSRRGI